MVARRRFHLGAAHLGGLLLVLVRGLLLVLGHRTKYNQEEFSRQVRPPLVVIQVGVLVH